MTHLDDFAFIGDRPTLRPVPDDDPREWDGDPGPMPDDYGEADDAPDEEIPAAAPRRLPVLLAGFADRWRGSVSPSELAVLFQVEWSRRGGDDLPKDQLRFLCAEALARRGHFAIEPEVAAAFQCVAEAIEPEDVDNWLVDLLLRWHALGILASAEGIGKSYARLELALRLATGTGSLFGHYPIRRPARVVLVDEENGPSEEYRRETEVLAALGLDRSALVNYFRVSYAGMNLTKPDRQEWLRAELDKIAPDLAIFDTGGAMVGDEWGEPLKEAVRYLRSLPCAVLVCVHLTKPPRERGRGAGQHGTALADVMGQWTRSADVVATMTDLGAGRARWTVRKRVPPSSLVLAQRGGLWDVVAVADDHEAASLDDRVLRAIAAGATSADELRVALGTTGRPLPKRSLYNALGRLRADGLVADGTPLALTDAGMESAE